jgi:dTDP-4-amino-4,6-dideoxygalactose transaminase
MADARDVYHIYCIMVEGDQDAVLSELQARGIEAGIHYPIPLHLQAALVHRGGREGDFPRAEGAARSILSLPIYPELTTEQINRVVEELAS